MSEKKRDGGVLYVVATPIGNLEDITLRALRVLKEVDVIACEDTRQTQKLLNKYQIRKRLVSYHEHNEMTRAGELVLELEAGAQVALVSDAGMPLISDPGHHLVAMCRRHGIAVVPVPGPSAVVAALAASGIATDAFLFGGFLPSRSGERRRALETFAAVAATLVFYEAPHRIAETLRDARAVLGNRNAVIAREVTKVHEEFLRGPLADLAAQLAAKNVKGEITLLIEGGLSQSGQGAQPEGCATSLPERVEQLMRDTGLDRKAALKQAARERGLKKREAYKQMLTE